MGDSKGIFLFYHLQGERGESSAHPNACKVYPAVAGKVTLAEVLAAFPLYGTASFHFRFQVAADKQIMFLDLTNPNDVVPMVNGSIIAKVLRLGTHANASVLIFAHNTCAWSGASRHDSNFCVLLAMRPNESMPG